MSNIPKIKLNNGVSMPAIGLGTWSGTTAEEWPQCVPWIKTGLKAGFRHLDTAWGYQTEKFVGQAIRESGIPREEIFVTSKLPPHHADRVAWSLNDSLQRFGYDYFDLYLMHWPITRKYREDVLIPFEWTGSWDVVDSPTFSETWAEMEKLLETGKVKAIGVSNFSIKTFEVLFKTAKVVPAVNQVEMHPLLQQDGLLAYCKSKGIVLSAYTPSGYSKVRDSAQIQAIAKKHGCLPNQVTLAWHVKRGTAAVPKSENPTRQKENLQLPELDEKDMEEIKTLNENMRVCSQPGPPDTTFGWTDEQLGWSGPRGY